MTVLPILGKKIYSFTKPVFGVTSLFLHRLSFSIDNIATYTQVALVSKGPIVINAIHNHCKCVFA